MNWKNNPILNPFTLLGLLVILFALLVQWVNVNWFHYPAFVGFPIAVALAIVAWVKVMKLL
jgi:hypothetical protein